MKSSALPASTRMDLSIGELSSGGDGVALALIDGVRRAIFIDGVALGELVRADVDTSKRPARGRVVSILEPSPRRVEPPCLYRTECGSCDWMHLDGAAQGEAHASVVKAILPEPVDPVVHSATISIAYRTRARLHVASEKKGGVLVGMFAPRTHEPVPVDTCVVLDPALDALRGKLAALLDGSRGRGEAQIALGKTLPVLELRWSGELPDALWGRLEKAIGKDIAGCRIFAGDVKIPARIGDPTPWMLGADGLPLQLGPGGFSQASVEGNVLLGRRVLALATELAPEGAPIVELHSGSGNLTVLLATRFAVTAVESDHDACVAARANLAARALKAKIFEQDAASFAIPNQTKLVVLDPPRTGAKAEIQNLGKVRSVLYVSCDPPTLGRDLATLSDRYAVTAVETFEMFPGTSHVETVVALRRRT